MKRFERHKSIGPAIAIIHRASLKYAGKLLTEHGISTNQIPYLMIIMHHENPSQEMLAQKLMVNKATVTRTIKQLIKLGFVKRKRSTTDKRMYHLSLTQKGAELLPQFTASVCNCFDTILDDLSEEEVDTFEQLLGKIVNKIYDIRGNNEKS